MISSIEQESDPIIEIVEEKIIKVTGDIQKRKYYKGRFLGKGDFSKCYELTCSENKKKFAAKFIPKNNIIKSSVKWNLISEIKIHKSCYHHHIVAFEHYFEDNENVYLLLEQCENGTLKEFLKKKQNLTELEVKYYIVQLIKALKYLHSQRIIHRDLKLEHLLLDDKMELKVEGFHFATKLEFEGEKKKTECGTPKYIAPEILNDNCGYSYEVDIWSLGIIMYTLLIGKTPFESNNENTTYKRIKMMDYTFPEETNISEAAKSLISQILVCDPSKRPKLDQILKHDFFLQEPSIQKSLQVSKISDLKQNMPDTKLIKKPFNDNNLGNNNEKDLKEKINQLNELLLEEKNKNEFLSKKINEYINTINKLNNEISEEKK